MNTHTSPHEAFACVEGCAVNVCANCKEDIMWMDTLDAWIHRTRVPQLQFGLDTESRV